MDKELTFTATIQDVSENDADAPNSLHMHEYTDTRFEQSMEIDGTCSAWYVRCIVNFHSLEFRSMPSFQRDLSAK